MTDDCRFQRGFEIRGDELHQVLRGEAFFLEPGAFEAVDGADEADEAGDDAPAFAVFGFGVGGVDGGEGGAGAGGVPGEFFDGAAVVAFALGEDDAAEGGIVVGDPNGDVAGLERGVAGVAHDAGGEGAGGFVFGVDLDELLGLQGVAPVAGGDGSGVAHAERAEADGDEGAGEVGFGGEGFEDAVEDGGVLGGALASEPVAEVLSSFVGAFDEAGEVGVLTVLGDAEVAEGFKDGLNLLPLVVSEGVLGAGHGVVEMYTR